MKQKPALIIAAGATVFTLALAGAAVRIASAQRAVARSSNAASPIATIAPPATDATALQYKQLIDEANARIQMLKDENASLRKQLETAKANAASAPAANTISADDAAQIALNLAPGAQLLSTPELVDFRGITSYEVVLDAGTVYVDAANGRPIYAISARQRAQQQQQQPVQPNNENEQNEEHHDEQNEGGASS